MRYFFLLMLVFISVNANSQIRRSLWSVQGINDIPQFTKVLKDSVYEIIYTGLPYKGVTKKTFAYYATPGSLNGNQDTGKFPAVILVHGGGGTAFPGWVKEWAKRGYAALAMDTRGNYPDGKHLPDGFQEANNSTPVYDVSMPLADQWFFQAIADIIMAHNLVRSFPEVDSSKTALAGISWGSVLSLVAASVDKRFKVTSSIYGCGFFPPSPKMGEWFNTYPSDQRETWKRQYDPANYVSAITHPVLFINGTNDHAFYLTQLKATAAMVKEKQFSIQPGLQHGHYTNGMGYEIQEHYAFIDQYLKNGEGLVKFFDEKRKKNEVVAHIKYKTPPASASLIYTTDTIADEIKRKWQYKNVAIKGNIIRSGPIPPSAVMYYLSVTQQNGLQSSGNIYNSEEK